MKKICLVAFSLIVSSHSFSQFKNIKLAEQDGIRSPIEPSVAINKKNTKHIVVGTAPNFVIVSTDGGVNWSAQELKSSQGAQGNPAVISNMKGRLFYFHLSLPASNVSNAWPDRVICQTWDEAQEIWSEGIALGNPPKEQDRLAAAYFPKKNDVFVTWTQFDKHGLSDAGCQSNILFSKSPNGNRFLKPVQINQDAGDCGGENNTALNAMPAIGLDGKIFVTWTMKGNIYMDRSYDDGSTWLNNDLSIMKQGGAGSLNIPGIMRNNSAPVLMIDNSEGRFGGTMYLVYADQQTGPEDTDIWLMRSRNRGDMWSKPVRVNKDDPGSHQFMPGMAIDQTNGNIYLIYYDRRENADSKTDVYLAYSNDGGTNFSEIKISELSFVPDISKNLGNYIGIDAHAGIIIPVWTRMDNGLTSIWTTVIRQTDLPKAPVPAKK